MKKYPSHIIIPKKLPTFELIKQNNPLKDKEMKQALKFITTLINRIIRAKVLWALPVMIFVLLLLPEKGWAQPNFDEDFTYGDGTPSGTNWTSNDLANATVQGNAFQLTSPGDDYSGIIWTTSELTSSCTTTPFYIDGSPINNSASGDIYFEYSLNDSDWDPVPSSSTGISGSSIYLRLRVDNIDNGETVTLDDVVVWEGLTVSTVKTDVRCKGSNDGTITATAGCGQDNNYSYEWHSDVVGFVDPGTATIDNLEPDDYYVIVSNTSSDEITSTTINISEPAETLTISQVDVIGSWSCQEGQGLGCCGSFSVTVSGGTPSYAVTIDDEGLGAPIEQTTASSTTFSNLCAENYSIHVVDENNCEYDYSSLVTITLDDQAPQNCDFPDNYSITYSAFEDLDEPGTSTINETSVDTHSDNPVNSDTTRYYFNANNYRELILNLTVTQSIIADWTDNDTIIIAYNFDGDWNNVTKLFEDWNYWSGSSNAEGTSQSGNPNPTPLNSPINLTTESPDFDANPSIYIYIITIAHDGNSYSANPLLQGFSYASTIPVEYPTGCDDNHGSENYGHTDGDINWIECSEKEFWFERTLTVTDDCENSTSDIQRISVGTPPVIDMSANEAITFDFCHNTQNINVPGVNDDCSDPADIDIEWVITDETIPTVLGSGSGNIVNFDFPVGATSVITWTATDEAGNPSSATQNVTINPEITVGFSAVPAIGSEICLEETVTFTLVVSGGTGTYNNYQFTPSGGTWTVGDMTYETDDLTVTTNYLSVTVTDSEGCYNETSIQSGTFNVHQLISTGTLERVD